MRGAAIVGLGYIGKVHLETLLRLPGVRVRALVDPDLQSAAAIARRYQIPVVTADYRELLGDPQIEVVHNCTPNHLHFAINRDFLQAGKHVFSEKPLAVALLEARELISLAAARDLLTAVNFCYRYYPVVQEAAARVHAGELGNLHTIMGSYLQDWLLYDTDYNWRLDEAVSGPAGAIADIGSHWCDLAQFVSGRKIEKLVADLNTTIPVRKRPRRKVATFDQQPADASDWEEAAVRVDDYGSVLLHFEGGARGAFTVSQLCAGRKCRIDLQLYGSKSSLAWNHENPSRLWGGHRDRANEIILENPLLHKEAVRPYALLPAGHPLGYYDAEFNLFSDFYRAIQLKEEGQEAQYPWPTFEDGYNQMVVVDAILRSQQRGSWVTV